MSLAYNLVNSLTETGSNEDITTLVIDHYTRTIKIPKGITNLGVTSDDEVLRLKFKMPRYLGTVDLYNFSIRINYINAQGEDDVYKVTDTAILGDNITFTWLVGPTATAYKGTTKFNVCMMITDKKGVIKQEYNTAVASLPVLEGLECSERVVSEYTDILEQWENRLFGIGDSEETWLREVSALEQENIANKGAEVLATIPEDYQTTTKLSNEGVRTKADAIICSAEGETIVVSDSSDDHIRGLKIFGKTTQVSTTGKNLLDVEENLIWTGVYGKEVSIPAGTYIVSWTASEYNGNNPPHIRFVTNDKWVKFDSFGGSTSITFDVAETNIFVYANGSSSANSEGITATVIQPMLSVNGGDYEPYSGGVASPSPDWPQELVSITNPGVNVFGKNLYTRTAKTSTFNGLTFTANADGSITVNGTATANAFYDVGTFLLPEGNYMLSGCTAGSKKTYLLYLQKTGGDGYVGLEDGEKVFTISDSDQRKLLIAVYKDMVASNLTFYPMISINGGEYEPPTKQSLSISTLNDLPGIPVTSGGNYTDANEQQWICDEIDFERGVYVQRLGLKTFTLYKSTFADTPLGYRYQHHAGTDFTPGNVCLCRTMSYNEDVGTVKETTDGVRINTSAGYIIAQYTDTTGTTETINLDILYILATPFESPLTADELAAFQALKTNYPNTTVLNDAGAWMNLRYNADTETWITNLIDEKIAAAVAKL